MNYFLLCVPFALSAAFYGGVNSTPQNIVCLISTIAPLILVWKRPISVQISFFWLITAILGVMLVTLVPLPIGIHSYLYKSIAVELGQSFQLLGLEYYPLSLHPAEQLSSIATGATALVICIASANTLGRTHALKKAAYGITGVLSAIVILGVIQRFTQAQSIFWISGVPEFTKRQFFGTWIYPNHAAVALSMTLPLFFPVKNAAIRWTGIGLWLVGLSLCQSRGGWMAAYVAVATYGVFSWKKIYASILPTVGVFVLAMANFVGTEWLKPIFLWIRNTPNEELDSGRQIIWAEGTKLLSEIPLIGVGYGGVEDMLELGKSTVSFSRTTHLHMEPLEVLITHGPILGSILIGMWILVLFNGFKRIKRLKTKLPNYAIWINSYWSGLMALTVHSFIDLSFRSQAVVFLAAIMIGPLIRRKADIFQNGALLPAVLSIVTAIFAISHHNKPLSPYSHYQYWSNIADHSSQQFSQTAFRYASFSRPLYARGFRLWGLKIKNESPKKAMDLVAHSSQLAPKNFINWMALAELYQLNNDCPAVWDAWAEVNKLEMESIKSYRDRVPSMFSCGSVNEALLVIKPNHTEYKAEIALWIGQNKNWDLGKALMEEALLEDQSLGVTAASLYYEGDDFLKAWELVGQKNPNVCHIALLQAKILQQLNHLKRAESLYVEASKLCGMKTTIERGLFSVRTQQGQPEALGKAIEILLEKPKAFRLRRDVINGLGMTEQHEAVINHYEVLFEQNQLSYDEQMDLIQLYTGKTSRLWPRQHITLPKPPK